MKNIVIWGTGHKGLRLIHFLKKDSVHVLAYTDNACIAPVKMENGYMCFPKFDALELPFDYIVIASDYYIDITSQLMGYGINEKKIIQLYNYHYLFPDVLFFFNLVDPYDEKKEIFTSLDLITCERM